MKVMTRDEEILKLCKGVLNASPSVYYNPNGADDSTCPFCGAKVLWADAEIEDINHDLDCAYLLAKDLSTGLLDLKKEYCITCETETYFKGVVCQCCGKE